MNEDFGIPFDFVFSLISSRRSTILFIFQYHVKISLSARKINIKIDKTKINPAKLLENKSENENDCKFIISKL